PHPDQWGGSRPGLVAGYPVRRGGLMAMYLGARMQKYFSDKWLKLMLGTIVFIIASRYVLRFF
ncbi:MAG: hypothetical protein KAS40_17240, partial [Desulfobacterales bacterium]|nr:hypothetical protein [Desulfobacterales bacterium]